MIGLICLIILLLIVLPPTITLACEWFAVLTWWERSIVAFVVWVIVGPWIY